MTNHFFSSIAIFSEVMGAIFIGLILSVFHWAFFFVAPAIMVTLFQYAYKYLYKMELAKQTCIGEVFYYKIILIQIIFISCVFIFIL